MVPVRIMKTEMVFDFCLVRKSGRNRKLDVFTSAGSESRLVFLGLLCSPSISTALGLLRNRTICIQCVPSRLRSSRLERSLPRTRVLL